MLYFHTEVLHCSFSIAVTCRYRSVAMLFIYILKKCELEKRCSGASISEASTAAMLVFSIVRN